MKIFLIFQLLLIISVAFAQSNAYRSDTISRNDIQLHEIDLRHGNTYHFNTLIQSDSSIFIMPTMLPKGYFEAFYNKDTNKLAFTFYNFGNKSYSQQFYADGSMKADSEYDKYGNMHGLHVVFDRNGEEIWHADYWHGSTESSYNAAYLEVYNYTETLILNKKAFGCYVFKPTPMRERHDEIFLKPDGSFSFHNYKSDCDCNRHSKGTWTLKDGLLQLKADNPKIWPLGTEKTFALIAKRGRKPFLIEYNSFGLNWYASEFYKCKKCKCFEH